VQNPRLLAVNYSPAEDTAQGPVGDASVVVGATRYENTPDAADRLVLDPAASKRNSLVLPPAEPRAYAGTSVTTVTYEGPIRGISDAPFSLQSSEEAGLDDRGYASYGMLMGGINAGYCASGVEDELVVRQRAIELSESPDAFDAAALQSFGRQHADYVDITEPLLDSDDPYWRSSAGRSCGDAYLDDSDLSSHSICELFFGSAELPDRHRELRIVRAFSDRLIVEPRDFASSAERAAILDLADCCFPDGVDFRVRGSGHWVVRINGRFPHAIQTNPETLACERGCNPLTDNSNGRVFEISCDGDGCLDTPDGLAAIGPSSFEAEDEVLSQTPVCILDEHPAGGVQPGQSGSNCIYDSLTSRFAIYRGLAPSERDMQFGWTTGGGFSPLSVDLFRQADFNTTTMPEKLIYVPEINRLLIADGGTSGMFFMGLRATSGAPGLSSGVAF